MSESSERNVEKLLKSAAASRREQAGTPQLHPATREILQTAVRRRYGSDPSRSREGFGLVLRWLPRLTVFVALSVCAWLFWIRDVGEAPDNMAMTREVGVPASTEKLLQDGGDSPADGVALTRTEIEAPAPHPKQAMPSAPASAAVAPQRPSVRTSGVRAESEGSVVGREYFKADRQAMYMGTASVEGEQPGELAGDADESLAGLMESADARIRVAPSELGAFTDSGAPPAGAVLQTFTLFNTGDVVRIVDADGSTYSGTLLPVTLGLLEESLTPLDGEPGAASETKVAKEVSRASSTDGMAFRNYRLVVAGTNRTLGQALRLEGQLALTELQVQQGRNVFHNTTIPAAGLKAARLNDAKERVPGRLQGTAVVTDGRRVPVDAVPARP
jgi:hypothetical protein